MITETLRLHAMWLADPTTGARADLISADLSGADLSGADLSGADLYSADLSCARLSGADLSCADLSCADLSCADLSCARLRGADLSGADLSGADLSGADLSGAIGVRDGGTDPRVGIEGHEGGVRISAGCRGFTEAEAREHWADNPDALARVDQGVNVVPYPDNFDARAFHLAMGGRDPRPSLRHISTLADALHAAVEVHELQYGREGLPFDPQDVSNTPLDLFRNLTPGA